MSNKTIYNSKFTIKRSEGLFYLAYIIYMVFSILSYSYYYKYFMGVPYKIILISCMLLLVGNEFLANGKINIRIVSGVTLIALMSFFTWRVSEGLIQNTVMIMLLFVIFGRNIQFEKISRITIILTSITVIFIILSAKAGIIEEYISTANGRYRSFLGFRYALYCPAFMANITALMCYKDDKKKIHTFFKYLFLILINILIFKETNARLSFILSMFLLAGFVFKETRVKTFNMFFVKWATILSYVIFYLLSICTAITYSSSNSFLVLLDVMLGGRISYAKNSLIKYGISLFGQQITWVGYGRDAFGNISTRTYDYVDNLYIQMLQHYGIIFAVLFTILITITIYRCYKQNKYDLAFLLFIISIHFIVDDLTLYLQYNTLWFLIGNILFAYRNNGVSNEHGIINRDVARIVSKN